MLAIKTEQLSKDYWITNHQKPAANRQQKWALKDVNIAIEQGDSVAILGKNGSGKSTLLKILSRIVHPTAGSFYINGRIAALLEMGVGFHPDLTGRENIFLKGTLLGMRYQDINKQLDAMVAFADIADYIDTPVKRYSSGMYMRLGFAVAAHVRSEILVIDEALAVGDISFQQKCFKKINELRQEDGRTILMVSHSTDNIRALCNKALLLEKGSVIASGTALDITAQYYGQSVALSATNLSESKNKYGNGKATVRSITVTDINGHPVKELYSGEPAKIVFQIDRPQEVKSSDIVLACALGISFGQYLVAWLSSESQTYPDAEGRLTLNIPSVDLRPGVYYFSYRMGIQNLDAENIADALENSFALAVVDKTNTRIAYPSVIGGGYFSND